MAHILTFLKKQTSISQITNQYINSQLQQNCSQNSPSFIAMSISWRSSSFNMDERNPSVVWFISEVEFCEYEHTHS